MNAKLPEKKTAKELKDFELVAKTFWPGRLETFAKHIDGKPAQHFSDSLFIQANRNLLIKKIADQLRLNRRRKK